MKKVLLFSAIALVALFSSCKKDAPTPQELILGKWKVTKLISDGRDLTTPYPEYTTEIEVECTESGSFILKSKETDFSVTPNEVYEGSAAASYSINGNQITVSFPSEDYTITGNLDVSSTRLTIVATSGDVDDFFSLLEADKI